MLGQSHVATPAEQLELFVGLAVPEPAPRRKGKRRPRAVGMPMPIQFAIDLRERVEVDPDEIAEEGDYFAHRVVDAAACEAPKTTAACSIFALAAETGAEIAARQVITEFMLGGLADKPPKEPKKPKRHPATQACVIREAGVTRHIAVRYQDTEEWAEKERERRARQKPPKPAKQKFKMKGTRQWADHQS